MQENKVNFVVMNEHMLGLINPAWSNVISILHASPLRGAVMNDMDGWVLRPINDKNVRTATRQDFYDYRVSFEYYQNYPELYNFPTD